MATPGQSNPAIASRPTAVTEHRRDFFAKAVAIVVGGIVALFPFAAGLGVLLDPLRRKADRAGFLRVATLDSVPDDGIPRRFPVLGDLTNAWNRYPSEPVGAVFLRRLKGETQVQAFNATCPHAGCSVEYQIAQRCFQCPCHDSRFTPEGTRIDPESCPSPRDLDSLVVDEEKLVKGDVWVEFKDFRAATPEKVVEG